MVDINQKNTLRVEDVIKICVYIHQLRKGLWLVAPNRTTHSDAEIQHRKLCSLESETLDQYEFN